jgi:hypothetical protein
MCARPPLRNIDRCQGHRARRATFTPSRGKRPGRCAADPRSNPCPSRRSGGPIRRHGLHGDRPDLASASSGSTTADAHQARLSRHSGLAPPRASSSSPSRTNSASPILSSTPMSGNATARPRSEQSSYWPRAALSARPTIPRCRSLISSAASSSIAATCYGRSVSRKAIPPGGRPFSVARMRCAGPIPARRGHHPPVCRQAGILDDRRRLSLCSLGS